MVLALWLRWCDAVMDQVGINADPTFVPTICRVAINGDRWHYWVDFTG
jgi:hypothetical protein